MKKLFIFLALFFSIAACTDDFEEMNVDKKRASEAPGATLFSNAQKELADAVTNANVNTNVFRLFAQHWTTTTYLDEPRYDVATRNIPQFFWHWLYRDVLRDLNEAKTNITDDPLLTDEAVKQNQLAIVEIMEVYTWKLLVDTFGDVPYSEALNFEIVAPKYDDDAAIYADLFTRLDAALATLSQNVTADPSVTSFDEADLIYGGDVAQWIKFGNSLKLKMGMTVADVDPAKAQAAVSEAAPNVFTSNADNAVFDYLAVNPNTNPLWTDLVESGRDDFVPANTLVDVMNGLEDPRREFFFTEFEGGFKGGQYGQSNNFENYSHINPTILEPDYDALLMDYSEVEFYLAEAVERGFIAGNAEEHYNNAIRASMEFWGVDPTAIDAYLAQPEVAYTSAASGQNFREKIGRQKWIALYNRGIDAWTEWRRLNAPQLVAPQGAEINTVPVRFPYPANESTLNTANYNAAATAIGGDDRITKVFWDVL
ncbi:hypothetical protein OB13_11330 [Pontibacter sp. HJ8]